MSLLLASFDWQPGAPTRRLPLCLTRMTDPASSCLPVGCDRRPSIAPRDRLQYASIYDRFRSSRKADFRPASATDDGTLRTALR